MTVSLWSNLKQRFQSSGGSAALLYASSSILARGVSILLAPIYTRRLTTSDYGDLALAQTLVAVIPTFVSLGLLAALSRFYYDGQSRELSLRRVGAVARSIIALGLVAAILLQIGAVAFAQPLGIFSLHTLSCVIWGATGTLLMGIPSTVLRASQRATAAAALQVIDFLISFGGALVLVAGYGRGLNGALEAIAISGVVNALVAMVFVFTALPAQFDWLVLKQAVRFSLPFVPHFAANQLLLMSDRWVLKGCGFDKELGVYALATQLAAPISLIVLAWNEAVTPKLGESFRSRGLEGLRVDLKRTVWSYLRLSVGVSVLVIAGSPLVRILFGANYGQVLWLLPVVCAALVIESFYYPFANVLFFANRTSLIPRITIGVGALNVVANLVLVPLFGLWGALASRLLASSVRAGVIAIAARTSVQATPLPQA